MSKRGLAWPWDHPTSLFTSHFSTHSPARISWLFNWELWRPQNLPKEVQWVPCLRTAAQINDLEPFLTDIKRNFEVEYLLGFNEPEISDQANLSVDEAVKLWREKVLPVKNKLGLKLGSPGMSSDPARALPWLDLFFEKLGGPKGAEVEFLVLHWYGTEIEEMKKKWLSMMHERYGLPVWVNEWACSRMGQGRSSEEEVETFVREGCRWMDETEWLQQYSYFGLGQGRTVGEWVGEGSNFLDKSGGEGKEVLTRVGKVYCEC